MAETALTLSFRRLRRRMLAVGSCSAAAWGATAAIALVAAGVWLDLIWELSSVVRIAACVVAVAFGCTLAAATLAAALGRSRDRALARRLDEAGRTGGQILSGHDLLTGPASAEAVPLTAGLARLAVDRAARLAADVPVALAVPAKPARRAGSSTVLVAAAMGLLALVAPRLASTEWLRFADPFGDHPPYSRTVLHVEPGNTEVLYGGSLDVLVTTEGPVADQVEIVLLPADETGDEQTLPMFPETGGKWRTQIAELHSPVRYFARTHSARSHRYQLGVVTVPQLESVTWRVAPPAYTRDAVYEGPLPPAGLAGLQGTQVQVVAESNRPLAGGSLELAIGNVLTNAVGTPAPRVIPLVPLAEGSRQVVGAFEIAAAGKLTLGVTDVAGQESLDKFQGTITVLADERPFVRLLEPPAVSLATPTATLPVAVAAEDDYGISRLQLFRSLNDSRATPVDLALETPPPRGTQAAVYLPLSEYGLEPGDVIKLYARVEDNDPAGAKGSESAVAVVQIIAAADYERMLRAREGMDVLLSKYQQAQRRMEDLAEEIEGLRKKLAAQPPDSPAGLQDENGQQSESDELREQLERLAQRLEEEAKALRESAEQLLPYDLDKALTEQLEQVAGRLDQAAEQARSLAAKPGAKAGDMARELDELKKLLSEKKQQFEKDVTKPMQDLADVYPLLEDSSRFVELYHWQRDLAERLSSLAGRDREDDPALKARMRDLETEQRGLREELGRLLDDIENHAARVPDEEEFRELVATALQFADAVRSSGANESMASGESGLAAFSGTQGHAGAKQAADILEQFVKRCEGMGNACEGACKGLKFAPSDGNPQGQGLGDTLAQLLADAGLKPGQGQGQGQPGSEKIGMGLGQGAGGGYSARRSSLQNIGLYGNLPTRGQPSRQGNGRGRMAMGGQGDGESNTSRSPGGLVRGGDAMRASGASEAVVPIRYRARVEQYFQRVAEETGGK